MKIIFFGTSIDCIPSLEALKRSRHEISAIVTALDSKSGRGMSVQTSEVKKFGVEHKIPLIQPKNVKCVSFAEELISIPADIFIVYAYGKILPSSVLSIPLFGSINIHASLLPKYRGAAPINWAIYNGETHTGISIMQMNEYLDRGDILMQGELRISHKDNAISIGTKIAHAAPQMLLACLKRIEGGKIQYKTQHDCDASYAPSLKKKDGLIDWHRSAQDLFNQIRAFVPWPGSFTSINRKSVKIWESEVLKNDFKAQPGEIVDINNNGIVVATAQKALILKEVQPEAKKKMAAKDFANGYKISVGCVFGEKIHA